jgi:hypothetical protein
MKKIVKIAVLNMPKVAWDEIFALSSILLFVLIALYVAV